MDNYKLGDKEGKFADIIWQKEPVTTRELTELCAEEFSWKRTTTYTMLRRLCDRGIFENRNGTVYSLMTRDEFLAAKGEQFINKSFGGSLPQFVAAFTRRNRLSEKEIMEIRRLIDMQKGGGQ